MFTGDPPASVLSAASRAFEYFVRFHRGYRVAERFSEWVIIPWLSPRPVHADASSFIIWTLTVLTVDGNGLLCSDEREDYYVVAGRYAVCTGCNGRRADGGTDNHSHAGAIGLPSNL